MCVLVCPGWLLSDHTTNQLHAMRSNNTATQSTLAHHSTSCTLPHTVCVCVRVCYPSFPRAPATSGLESPSFGKADVLANHMGLFLQKTNIIRDYLVGGGTAGTRRGADPGGGGHTAMC